MPGNSPSLVTTSLWQTPQACTRILTCPVPGSGISRSTTSKSAPGLGTCTAIIFGIASPCTPAFECAKGRLVANKLFEIWAKYLLTSFSSRVALWRSPASFGDTFFDAGDFADCGDALIEQ